MTRATTPQHPLGGIVYKEIPEPLVKVGDYLDKNLIPEDTWKYIRKLLLRHSVRFWQDVSFRSCKRRKLSTGGKKVVRQVMKVIDTCHTIQVAGIAPFCFHGGDSTANQCYISEIQGATSMSFRVFLLFRAKVGKNEVFCAPSKAILSHEGALWSIREEMQDEEQSTV